MSRPWPVLMHSQLRCATPTAKQPREHGAALAGGAVMARSDRVVGVNCALDALEALPVDVAFVCVRDQHEPLLARLLPIALTCFPAHVTRAALALAVGIGTAVRR